MERNFTDENMEEFLRRSAEGLRMRPSAKVWKGISNHLNRRRRRIGLVLGTSLLLTTALGYYLSNETSKNIHQAATPAHSTTEKRISQPTSFITVAGKRAATANTPSGTGSNILPGNASNTDHFSFVDKLLQRNEEAAQTAFTPSVIDDAYFGKDLNDEKQPDILAQAAAGPFSIESVWNSYRPKKKKLTWQAYFTPTVSYRKLNDGTISNMGIAHKPAFGFQLGTVAKYPVSKNAKLRAGLQFNVNRYEIKTNDSYSQLATIRLVDRNGVDYVRKITNYNNFSGYQTNWLQNMYVQLSAPIGVEVKVAGDDKMQFGLASTLQPTYIIGDKAYLISADYKNYTEMPNLVRRWNVNTSLETFVGYSTGHINWQIGPQVRYQLLSSYLKKYPVKENLFDFGLRVGMSFNK